MKKILSAGILALSSLNCHASGAISSLKVDSDVVYFSTSEAKNTASPACMNNDNAAEWTLSLNTATGKAAYSLLVTALASNRNVSIESAGDCDAAANFERAKGVSIDPVAAPTTGDTGGFTPAFKEVAYGFIQNTSSGSWCRLSLNSNDEQGRPYLKVESYVNGAGRNHCRYSCENGSEVVLTGGLYASSHSEREFFACMIPVE